MTFAELHNALQAVMGWTDTHLHNFRVGQRTIAPPDPYGEFEDGLDERTTRLSALLPGPGAKAVYTYDFGDDWMHDIAVEKVLEPAAGLVYPVCTGGKRNRPPEDCGGVWGYNSLLAALSDPDAADEDGLTEMYEGFDPEEFSIDEANAASDRCSANGLLRQTEVGRAAARPNTLPRRTSGSSAAPYAATRPAETRASPR